MDRGRLGEVLCSGRPLLIGASYILAVVALLRNARTPMPASSTYRSWRPLLEGNEADLALRVAQEIADALPDPSSAAGEGSGVAGGYAGIALLHAFLARAGRGTSGAAELWLNSAIKGLAEEPLPAALYSGFSGVAWMAELLEGSGEEEDDINADIDDALLKHVSVSPWHAPYDLVSGSVGVGLYALERVERPSAAAVLEQVVARLEEISVRTPPGIAWHTAPELLPEHQRPTYPLGYYNLGLAHGAPGIVSVLAQACAAGVAADRARPLLDGAVAWLLAQELPPDSPSRFAYSVAPGVEASPARAAWCYGDPGIAAAMLCAARCVGNERWEEEALRIARSSAARAPDQAGVVDAGICHGAAGLALIYARMHQATGDEVLGDAAREWVRRTLDLRRPGEGVAGYLSWEPGGGSGTFGWQAAPGLLTGAAGVGLVLLAVATPVEPAWDRMLLISSRYA